MMSNELFKKCYPGFTVKCDKCGSEEVYLDDTRGWSQLSGSWGELSLICNGCGNTVEIAE